MDEIIFFMESLISKLLMAIPPEITKASGFNNGSICKGHWWQCWTDDNDKYTTFKYYIFLTIILCYYLICQNLNIIFINIENIVFK